MEGSKKVRLEDIDIRIIDKTQLSDIVPFLQHLNPYADIQELEERVEHMALENYECVGCYLEGKLIAICGLWFLYKHYVGKHVEPDNVVLDPNYRNQGIGEYMMQWVYDYARSKGCVAAELNCYVQNSKGHKFWLNQGYRLLGLHYQKRLDEND